MLEIQRIRTEKDQVIKALEKRHFDAAPIVEEIIEKDQKWRQSKGEMESIAAELKLIAKSIGQLFAQGKQEEANAAKAQNWRS